MAWMPPPLSNEVLLAYVALAAGTAIAVIFASRRATPDWDADADLIEETGVSEHPSSAYHQGVLPLQEETNAELVAKLRKAAKELAARMPEGITSDDIFEVCDIPANVDRRIMGAVFNKEEWVHVGWQPTRRRAAHGRPIRIWLRKVG